MLWLIGTLVKGTDIEGHAIRKQSRRKSIVQPFMIFYSLPHAYALVVFRSSLIPHATEASLLVSTAWTGRVSHACNRS